MKNNDMPNQQLSEGFLTLLWQSIQNGGPQFWIFLIILILIMFKNDIPAMIKGIWSSICWFSKNILLIKYFQNKNCCTKKTYYNKETLLNHQLFKDLNYWLTIGIDTVKITDNKAKEIIAKDIFKIYVANAQKTYMSIINNDNINDLTNDELKSLFKREIEKKNSNVIYTAQQEGIPELFLQKYFMISENFQSLKNSVIDTILSNDFEADNYTKLSIIFNTIDGTVANIFHNLVSTVKSINGDLNGLEYKGFIIGYKPDNTLLPPIGTDVSVVEDKLKELMFSLNASRAYIYKFHPEGIFNKGYHSCVYEVVNAGISKEKIKLQKLHNTFLSITDDTSSDIMIRLKNESDTLLAERMNQRGIYALAHILLFNNKEKADGMLVVNWSSKDSYEQAIKENQIKEKLHFYGELLQSYIIYPADYNFN